MTKRESLKLAAVNERIVSEEILDQKSADYIRELNSYSAGQLDHIAFIDENRRYSYRQMFRQWDYYAEVFSALHMTGENRSRVCLLGGICTEAIFSFYALNRTGASVSVIASFLIARPENLKNMIRREGITDLIVTDVLMLPVMPPEVFPKLARAILSSKEELGLRNVIFIHVPISSRQVPWLDRVRHQMMYEQLREIPGLVLMENLLERYEAAPIHYDKSGYREDALILHTSGTTKGISKPVSLSDRAFNSSVNRFLLAEEFAHFRSEAVTVLTLEIALSYSFIDIVHLPLAFGGTVIVIPQGVNSPLAVKAIGHYQANILFVNGMILETWIKLGQKGPDLSSLKLIALGGSYISPENRKRYNAYIRERGARIRVSNGYGLSEVGGACLLGKETDEDDSIGYALPGISVRIYDEEEKQFFSPEEGPRTGGLYLSASSLASGKIGEESFFELVEIDGLPYYDTCDLVRVKEDGSLICIGRTSKYFVNDEGSRFQAGLVENRIAAQDGIRKCVIVPDYSKLLHDTVPVLYLVTGDQGSGAARTAKAALLAAYKGEDLQGMPLPEKLVITEDIPYNAGGKLGAHTIREAGLTGQTYLIHPVKENGVLIDIRLETYLEGMDIPGHPNFRPPAGHRFQPVR